MNIYLEEIRSGLKNEFIQGLAIDKLHRKCGESIGINITDILLNEQNEKHKKIILSVLKKYGFNFNSFYINEAVDCAALDNPVITGGILIKGIMRDDKQIILYTKDGEIKVDLLAETLGDSELLLRKSVGDLLGSCHELTAKMLEKNKMKAITAFCPYNFCENIIHSFNVGDDGMVYDVSHNIIMPQEEYNRFFQPVTLSEITPEEYYESKEYDDFENHLSTEFPLYSIAKKRTRDKTFKSLKKGISR